MCHKVCKCAVQFSCTCYTFCLGRKHNQAGAAIQSVWGASTIKLGRLYSLSGAITQFVCTCGTITGIFILHTNQTLKNKKVRFQKTRNGLVTLGGLEPSTLCLEGRCSNPAELKRRMKNSLYYFAHFFKCKS